MYCRTAGADAEAKAKVNAEATASAESKSSSADSAEATTPTTPGSTDETQAVVGKAFVANLGPVGALLVDDTHSTAAGPVLLRVRDTIILSVRHGILDIWSWNTAESIYHSKLPGREEITALAVIPTTTGTGDVPEGDKSWIVVIGVGSGEKQEPRAIVVVVNLKGGVWDTDLKDFSSTHSKPITSIALSTFRGDIPTNLDAHPKPSARPYSGPRSPLAREIERNAPLAHIAVLTSQDKSSTVWHLDRNDVKCIYKLDANCHTDHVLSVAVHGACNSLKHMTIITGGCDKALRFWNLEDAIQQGSLGELLDTDTIDKRMPIFAHKSKITCIEVFEVKMQRKPHTVGHKSIDDSEDDTLRSYMVLVTGSMDKTVILWDYKTMDKIKILKGHTRTVTALVVHAFTKDSEATRPPLILSGGEDKTVIIWDMMTGHAMRTLSTAEPVASLSCSDELGGLLIATGGADGRIQFWDLARTGRTEKLVSDKFGPVTGLATYRDPSPMLPSKTHLLISDVKGTVSVYNLDEPANGPVCEQVSIVGTSKGRLNNLIVGVAFPPVLSSDNVASTPAAPSACDIDPFYVTCDGSGTVMSYNLRQQIEKKNGDRDLVRLIDIKEADKKVVFALAIFDPRKIRRSDGSHIEQMQHLEKPYVISGSLSDISFWDISQLAAPHSPAAATSIIPTAHEKGQLIRAFALYHPVIEGHKPLLVSASWDETVKVWDLTLLKAGSNKDFKPLHVLEGHDDKVMLVYIYDPFDHIGSTQTRCDPIVITGGYDCAIKFWDLFIGDCKKTLKGHSEAVTAMDLYVPKSEKEVPMLITGSIDRLIMVWNVWTGERIHTLVRHSDRVCCLHVHRPANPYSQPWLASGGDDSVVCIWKDALYPSSFMPLHIAIVRIFETDLGLHDWPLMSELVCKYKVALFLENPDLFARAVHYGRPDFLLKFRSYLSECIRHCDNVKIEVKVLHHLPTAVETLEQIEIDSFLDYAISRGDMISVRAILLCWVENLNKDIHDLLTQNVFHACHFFCSLGQLEWLSKKYPWEYSLFVGALQLVRNHPSLVGTRRSHLHFRRRYEVSASSSNAPVFDEVWHNRLLANSIFKRHTYFWCQFWKIFSFVAFNSSSENNTPASNSTGDSAIATVSASGVFPEDPVIIPPKVESDSNEPPIRHSLSASSELDDNNAQQVSDDKPATSSEVNNMHFELPVVSLLLPLRYPLTIGRGGAVAMLDVSNKMNYLEIFNSVFAIYTSQYFWHDYGRLLHFLANGHFMAFLVAFIAFIHVSLEESFVKSAGGRMFCACLILYLLFYLLKEGRQVINQHGQSEGKWYWRVLDFLWKFFTLHLKDVWNVMDVFVVLCGTLGLTMVFTTGKMSTHARCLLAWCSVAMWIRLMFFFRPFSNAGPLGKPSDVALFVDSLTSLASVVMILRIAWDIRFFMVVLLCFIMGFAQAFWLLSYQNKSLPFAKFGNSMLNSYYYMLGLDVDTDFHDTISPGLATFLLSLFTLIMMILMLNLLIALMGNTYSEIWELKSAPWRRERIAVMCEHALDSKIRVNPNKFIHVMKYVSDVASIHDDKSEKDLIAAVNESRARSFGSFIL